MVPLLPQEELVARRQDLPNVYALNGTVYVSQSEKLSKFKSFVNDSTISYIMSSNNSVDIDNLIDFKSCEFILSNKNNLEIK